MFYRIFIALAVTLLAGCNITIDNDRPLGLDVVESEAPAGMVTKTASHVYKQNVIIGDGYANISAQLSDNPAQRRLMAIRASKIDAYRNLTEKVYGQNINATTTVEDMVATNDAVRAHVEGVIYGARLVSITPVGNDSYVTRLELDEGLVKEIRRIFLFRK